MRSDVVYDWNTYRQATPPKRSVQLHDETLRDGIQCPSVQDPGIDDKLAIVRLLDRAGVDTIDVGLPGAGPRAIADSEAIVTLIRDEGLTIRPTCAARTHPNDIAPIIAISERTGVAIEVMAFLGSSPIRMYAETWDEAKLEQLTRTAARMTVDAGLPFSFVTEDTVRSHPTTLRRLFVAAVEEGASCLVLCDTVGHATPRGTRELLGWTDGLLRAHGVRDRVTLDWHGHNDRGLALINTIAAIDAGCDRVHGTILGVGERVGNTSLDQLLVNLRLSDCELRGDLSVLHELVDRVSDACKVPVPVNYPVFGLDAFRTGTGVHAAAVIKAKQKGDDWLADRIYSGVPAGWFGLQQRVEIGHQSGLSNVRFWLQQRNIEADEALVRRIFDAAKRTNRLLAEHEIMAIIEGSAA
ncbi:MAG: 2-isopropylmalate synthase [Myxococcota bacterium]|jgi:2-isopropylmalate synthase